MSCCGKRRAAASTSSSANMAPTVVTTAPTLFEPGHAQGFASAVIQEWMECLYHGKMEILMRGPVTGEQYHLRPGMQVKLSHRDWSILKRTGLLQQLMS